MSDHASWIDRRVVAKTGPGEVYAEGRVVSYTAAPTFTIETDTGDRVHWRADLTELAETDVDDLTDALLSETELGFDLTRAQVSRIARRLIAKGVRVGGESR